MPEDAYLPGSTEPPEAAADRGEQPEDSEEEPQEVSRGKSFRQAVQKVGLVADDGTIQERRRSCEGALGQFQQLASSALAGLRDADDDIVKMEKMYRIVQIHVNKGFILRELIPYSIFLIFMVTVIMVSRTEHHESQVHNMMTGIRASLLETGFRNSDDMRFYKQYKDISYDDEFWEWFTHPVASTLFSVQSNKNPHGLLNWHLKPLRFLILRQQRVRPQSCSDAASYDMLTPLVQGTLPTHCLPDYECNHITCNLDEAPFGPGGKYVSLRDSGSALEFNAHNGDVYHYRFPERSYVQVFNVDRESLENVTQRIQQLRADAWLNNATRYISVELITFDRNIDVFCWNCFYTEVTAGGVWLPQTRMVPFGFMSLKEVASVAVIILDVFITIFFCYVMYRLVQGIFRHYKLHREIIGYFRFWNTYTIFDMCMFGVTYGYRWSYWHFSITAHGTGHTERDAERMWTKLAQHSLHFETSWNVYGYAALLAFGGLVRFIQYNPRMNMVFTTIERALGELLVIVLLLILDVLAFGLLSNILFGYYMIEFHSFFSSSGTLMRMLIGDFPEDTYWRMRGAQNNAAAASSFLLFYFLTAWLLLLNLVIGVVAEAFASVKDAVGSSDFDFFGAVQNAANLLSGLLCPSQDDKERRRAMKQLDKMEQEMHRARREGVYSKLKELKASSSWRVRMTKRELMNLHTEPDDPDGAPITWNDDDLVYIENFLQENALDVCERAVESEEQETLNKIYAICMQLLAAAESQGRQSANEGLLQKLNRRQRGPSLHPAPRGGSPDAKAAAGTQAAGGDT